MNFNVGKITLRSFNFSFFFRKSVDDMEKKLRNDLNERGKSLRTLFNFKFQNLREKSETNLFSIFLVLKCHGGPHTIREKLFAFFFLSEGFKTMFKNEKNQIIRIFYSEKFLKMSLFIML